MIGKNRSAGKDGIVNVTADAIINEMSPDGHEMSPDGHEMSPDGPDARIRLLEDRLRQKQEQLRIFTGTIRNSGESIAVLDKNMRYLFVNDQFIRDYRINDKDLAGKCHYDVFPEIPERWKEIHRQVLSGSIESAQEDRFDRADGTVDYLRWELRPWHDARGNIGGMVLYSNVVTGHKRAEDELRKSNRALRVLTKCNEAMIQAVDEAVLLKDICRIIVEVGDYRLAWIGYIEPDAVRTVRPVARAGHDEGYVDNLKIALEDPLFGSGPTGICLKTGKPYSARDVQNDQSMEPWRSEALKRGFHSTLNLPIIYEKQVIGSLVIYSGAPKAFDEQEKMLMFEMAGNLAYGITAIRDRLRRIHAEEELKLSNAGLELRVSERTRDLEKINMALQESRSELARAQQIAHIGSWTWDIARDEIAWSDESYRIYGLEPGALKPSYELFLSFIAPVDRGRVDGEVRQALETGNKYSIIYNITRKDGVSRIVLSENELARDGSGKVILMYGTNQDITGRRKAEKELIEAREQAELYLDLMCHDISNMHQIAMGQLELAQDVIKTDGKLEADDEEMIDISLASLARSAMLIDNVRKLQKIRSEEVKNIDISLDDVLAGVVDQYNGMDPGGPVRIVPEKGRHFVKANELLRDVFANLIGNAIKHSNSGNVEISVRLESVRDNDKKCYKVSIEDNGPGVPDDMKDKVFNRLQRGETRARGMGLGLYLVKSLIDSYHGKVWVEDRVANDHSKGARFVVLLSAVDE